LCGSRSHKKNPAAVALGKVGGTKGGRARAAKLTSEETKEIVQRAAKGALGQMRVKLGQLREALLNSLRRM
jgi:hypothetical protein